MNALKPTTPSSASSASCATLPGTSPPQSAKSVTAAPSAASTFRRNASASTVGGCAFSGMSTTHVVPPAAAAAVPLAQPSQSARPGSLKCTCASTAPGRTRSPVASTVSVAASPSSAPVATILPSSTATSTGSQPRIRRSTSATRLFSPACLQVPSTRILDRLDALYALGDKIGYSAEEDEAHRLARGWMEEAGLAVEVDDAGNLVGGSAADADVWVGSHLDSVPGGGKFDGMLGVVAGIEAVERTGRGSVVVFRDEERGCAGSRARRRVRTAAAALRRAAHRAGARPARLGSPACGRDRDHGARARGDRHARACGPRGHDADGRPRRRARRRRRADPADLRRGLRHRGRRRHRRPAPGRAWGAERDPGARRLLRGRARARRRALPGADRRDRARADLSRRAGGDVGSGAGARCARRSRRVACLSSSSPPAPATTRASSPPPASPAGCCSSAARTAASRTTRTS